MSIAGIAYDHKRLEKLASGSIKRLEEDDLLGRIAARTVCDFHLGTTPADRLGNAQAWIESARREAFQAGVQHGKDLVRRRIITTLGLRED